MLANIGTSHLFVEMFVRVANRDEHLQNMKEFKKCFDLHQTIFEQCRTLPNMKFIIERGGQTHEHFAEHESSTLFVELFVAFGQGLILQENTNIPQKYADQSHSLRLQLSPSIA